MIPYCNGGPKRQERIRIAVEGEVDRIRTKMVAGRVRQVKVLTDTRQEPMGRLESAAEVAKG